MIEIKDIEKLAKLSRIELTDTEKQTYLKDIGSILGYVDQVKNAVSQLGEERKVGDLRNVMRKDEGQTESGINTKDIVAEFPKKESDYLKVKKILEQ
jgi:aspartyl-tRNA(Asn)/glutamyl-tRNA(Gln) amidotransferase subunit C